MAGWGTSHDLLERCRARWQDLDNSQDHNRHISQLYALLPGGQISASTTPELFNAAKVTLRTRGGFEVDRARRPGILAAATLHSLNGNPALLRYDLATRPVNLAPGQSLVWNGR